MIDRIKQSVELLPSISEEDMLSMFAHIMATPYGNNIYDLPKTERIVESCVRRGHLSILEHGNISIKCITNIGTYKDYTRHRHCAFTIESTSFTKYDGTMRIITVHNLSHEEEVLLEKLQLVLANNSIKVARDFIPQCCAATMIMTTNIREWRHIIGTRGDPNDNPLTIELRNLIWQALNTKYPFFFPLEDNTIGTPMCIYDTWGERKPSTWH
jgi:thymidylate synthase (FAD)